LTTDVILVGGGLANSLIGLRLQTIRPDISLLMLEQGGTLGGNHTWSFHHSDLTPEQRAWLAPLIEHCWDQHEVRFPAYRRALSGTYASITSGRLHREVSARLGAGVRFRSTVQEIWPEGVRLHDGTLIPAALVIDGRGFQANEHFELRYQKFLGQVVSLAAPHGLSGPLIMDATIVQRDGYRFVYVLPLAERQLLIEDTYYSDQMQLASDELRRSIHDYAAAKGWQITDVVREETGVLPIVLDGAIDAFWEQAGTELPRAGLRAMLFHHTTGYSLPEAVRLAEQIAAAPELESPAIAVLVRQRARHHWREQRVYRLLNRMLFDAAEPAERYRVLEHFYRLPESTIARFYAGRLQWHDVLRLCTGRPPVPVGRALHVLSRRARAAALPGKALTGGTR
jgi:lycopene beta-cyclase